MLVKGGPRTQVLRSGNPQLGKLGVRKTIQRLVDRSGGFTQVRAITASLNPEEGGWWRIQERLQLFGVEKLGLVGLCGFEPQTSVLSGPRSSHLS